MRWIGLAADECSGGVERLPESDFTNIGHFAAQKRDEIMIQ